MIIKDDMGKAIRDILDDKSHAIGCLLILALAIITGSYYANLSDKTLDVLLDISWLMAGIVGLKHVVNKLIDREKP